MNVFSVFCLILAIPFGSACQTAMNPQGLSERDMKHKPEHDERYALEHSIWESCVRQEQFNKTYMNPLKEKLGAPIPDPEVEFDNCLVTETAAIQELKALRFDKFERQGCELHGGASYRYFVDCVRTNQIRDEVIRNQKR